MHSLLSMLQCSPHCVQQLALSFCPAPMASRVTWPLSREKYPGYPAVAEECVAQPRPAASLDCPGCTTAAAAAHCSNKSNVQGNAQSILRRASWRS